MPRQDRGGFAAETNELSEGRHELHFDRGEDADVQVAGDAAELHSALGGR